MIRKRLVCGSMLGLALLTGLVLSSAASSAATDSQEVSDLLAQARTRGVVLLEDAITMKSFAHLTLTWETHTTKIEKVKADVEAVAKSVTKLAQLRDTASPRQQDAIDRVTSVLREVAASVEGTIGHLIENRQNITTCVQMDPMYKHILAKNADLATRLADTLADVVKAEGAARAKA